MNDGNSQRILILSHSHTLAAAKAESLRASGFFPLACQDFKILCNEISGGVGVLMVSQEALTEDSLILLSQTLRVQPAWSQIPIVVMLDRGELADGNEQWLQIIEPLGHVNLIERPITDKVLATIVRTALAFRKRQYEVRELLVQLEISSRAKTEFLSNVSHEIRTPLSAMLGFSELLMDGSLSAHEQQVYLSTIRRNGRRLSGIIDDILDLTRFEMGDIKIKPLEFKLEDVIRDVITSLEADATQKRIALTVEHMDYFPETIRADFDRLRQILQQIVGNAIKFTSHGSVVLRISGGAKSLRIEVEDSGIGISRQQSESLFKPFCQLDSSPTRKFGGTGLGLALARKLARAMGGDLKLAWSIPGGGSCFALTLGEPSQSLPRADRIAY